MSASVEANYPTVELATAVTPVTGVLEMVGNWRPPPPRRLARRRIRLSRRGRVVGALLGLIAVVGGATGWMHL